MIVSIVIPVYNEALLLPMVLERVVAAPLPAGCEKEIVVVNDGSTDSTGEVLDRYHQSHFIVVHHSPVNFGKGAAVRLGLTRSSGDVILIQDGDLKPWIREESAMRRQRFLAVSRHLHGFQHGPEVAAHAPFVRPDFFRKSHST